MVYFFKLLILYTLVIFLKLKQPNNWVFLVHLRYFTDSHFNFRIKYDGISQNLPYDYASVMHYRHSSHSKTGRPVIIPRRRSIPITYLSSSPVPTDLDYLHINLLYCGGTATICILAHYANKNVH